MSPNLCLPSLHAGRMSTPTPAGAGGEEGAAETPSAPPPRQPAKRGRKPNAEKQRILLQQQQEAAARAAAEAEAEADDTPGTPTAKGPGTAASRAGSSSEVAAVGGSSDGTALPGAAGGAGATSSSRQAATNSTSLTSSSNKRERTETTKERKERQKLQRRNLFSKDLPAMMCGFSLLVLFTWRHGWSWLMGGCLAGTASETILILCRRRCPSWRRSSLTISEKSSVTYPPHERGVPQFSMLTRAPSALLPTLTSHTSARRHPRTAQTQRSSGWRTCASPSANLSVQSSSHESTSSS